MVTNTAGKYANRQLSSDSHESSEDMEGIVTDLGYDSYATAWRYLGVFDDYEEETDDDGNRRLKSNDGNGGSRKLLWAAYYDPYYSGEQIGDYQFYVNGEWNNSTCTEDGQCAKMDCHDVSNSNWQLLGVYKESVSFEDDTWFEQLFKHEGYCLWDQEEESSSSSESSDSGDRFLNSGSGDSEESEENIDLYEFMQTMRQELPEGCTEAGVFGDDDGSSYYIDIKPQEQGQMYLGVYTDSSCQEESSSYTFSDYIQLAYGSYSAMTSEYAFDTWNSGMDSYKVCQPCRSYSLRQSNHRRRFLGEENDGEGDNEQNGYDCNDDAGFLNCNQCYKFETHTDMEVASASDLEKASNQGTILLIQYDGTWYGSGTVGDGEQSSSYQSSYSQSSYSQQSSNYYGLSTYCFAGGASLLLFGFALRGFIRRRRTIVLADNEGLKPLH